jgi:hypothetical protein
MTKYLYFEPKGGFNDVLCSTALCLGYCMRNNRVLLVNGLKSDYKIHFPDYFETPRFNKYIIYDIEQIKTICLRNSHSIYPSVFQNEMNNILSGKIEFTYTKNGFIYKDITLKFPDKNITEDIIVYSCGGGGYGIQLLRHVVFKKNVIDICNARYKTLHKPYLGIQIRNTDIKCDYVQFFNENETLIKSYSEIYLATDDVNVLTFFRDKGLLVKNFTTFPGEIFINLHNSKIDPSVKFTDMISDMFILSLSNQLISPSAGGFARLIANAKDEDYFKPFVERD